MAWIDEWLPQWQFDEVHHIRSRASPAALLDATAAYDPAHDRVINAALSLREAPARLAAALGLGNAVRPQRFGLADFVLLGRHGDEALAYGLVGRFWEPGYGLQPLADAEAFRAYGEADAAKLVLGFEVRRNETPSPHTTLTTLTRVACADPAARRRLAAYWTVIRPMSGLIRQRILADIRRAAEHADPAEPG
ncbi:MAG: hypothetical protein Q7U26_00545 [Aquabacterium sp.]|nr:hypothetical protein [Aquabacterium sp.]